MFFICIPGIHVSNRGKIVQRVWRGTESQGLSGEASSPWFCRCMPTKTQTQCPQPRQSVYRTVTAINIVTQITFALQPVECLL